MFIAKHDRLQHIIRGSELPGYSQAVSDQDLHCPSCGAEVSYNAAADHPFEFFGHVNGSPDCFASDAVSDEHRLAAEVAVESIHNRIREVTGKRVDIDTERWIGSQRNFVVADVRVTSPILISAEIYYRSGYLELARRLKRIFRNDYRTFLIFHTSGRYNVKRVEQHLQKIAPLRVGRFNPETRELTLGDLFSSSQIQFDQEVRDALPSYIY